MLWKCVASIGGRGLYSGALVWCNDVSIEGLHWHAVFRPTFRYGLNMVEGDQITPDLTLIRTLGRPDSSHVWLARNAKLDQDVVVKVLGKALARNSSQLHRFHREAGVVENIQNAHIALILGHGLSTSGRPYLEMQLLDGEDLAARLSRDGTLILADVARLINQVARGLGKAHMLGLVHRNLKPENIFLVNAADGNFDVKILDLGLSSGSDLMTASRAPMGAPTAIALPQYASPEQVFGVKDVDSRTDLWAIAVVAYQALTGRMPFPAPNPGVFVKAIEEGTFELPSQIVPSLPPAVDAWFVKAFQRDPTARFGGARELADEFVRAVRGDFQERLTRSSALPPVPGQRFSRLSEDFSDQRLSILSKTPSLQAHERVTLTSVSKTPSLQAHERLTVIGVRSNERSSSSLVVALLAIIGIGTVLAGFSLLNH